ncbi:hypothetical protein AB0E67_11145 [Streptomyces sp. NPDC032161]|uniref:hypothetical protein n=1 Tax=unclassified Streptomyces TaxID=2593676 RepID=UPI0033EC9A8E
MSRPRATRTARATARPRRVGRPLLSGLALATATAVAAVVITRTAPEKPGTAPSTTSGSGSQVLLAAASHVSRQQAGSGTYWYVEEHSGHFQKVPGRIHSRSRGRCGS